MGIGLDSRKQHVPPTPLVIMSIGLEATFQYLTKTDNPVALELLEAALDCPYGPVREKALSALLARPNRAVHRKLFDRLDQLDAQCKAILTNRPDRLVAVVGEIFASLKRQKNSPHRSSSSKDSPKDESSISGGQGAAKESSEGVDCNPRDFVRACQVVRELALYETLPNLVQVVESAAPRVVTLAAQTVLDLVKAFYTELSSSSTSARRDIQGLRMRMTDALQAAASTYSRHGRQELLEAFLLVAKPQNVVLRRILHDPKEPARVPVLDILTRSPENGVFRLLLGFLEDPQSPQAALEILGQRTDSRFIQIWAEEAGYPTRASWQDALKRIRRILWAEPRHPIWPELDGKAQAGAVGLMMSSKMDRTGVLQVLEYLLQEGKPEGRRAAAGALVHFSGPQADALILQSLNDPDPWVQAECIRQLRPRNIPEALSLLVRVADSEEPTVRQALQEALPEFTCKKFLATFDHLPDELRQTAGYLVRKIDLDAPNILLAEVQNRSPVRRRRAVEAASAMGTVPELEYAIIPLLQDEDHRVRVAAAKALADCRSQPTWEALRDALFDRSMVVREEADKSLQWITASLSGQVVEPSETPVSFDVF